MTTIYIYSNEDGKQVSKIEGIDIRHCEEMFEHFFDSNEYHFSTCDVEVSNAT